MRWKMSKIKNSSRYDSLSLYKDQWLQAKHEMDVWNTALLRRDIGIPEDEYKQLN